MSAFEVALTPPHIRNARKNPALREPTRVELKPFYGKPIIAFEDVPVTKTARRTLIIRNPSDYDLKVLVTKIIRPEANAQLEWTSKEIPANDEASMEIVWSPLILWSSRETIQFTDNRNLKVDVVVILKSVDKKARTKNALMLKPSSSRSHTDRIVTKKLTLKSPSPRTKQRLRKTAPSSPSGTATTATSIRRKVNAMPWKPVRIEPTKKVLGIQNQISEQIDCVWDISKIAGHNSEKENIKPTTPKSGLSMFETFKFTPVMPMKVLNGSNVEFLASLPTPSSTAKLPASNKGHVEVSPSDEFRRRATSPCHNGFNITTTIEMTPQTNGVNNQTTTLYKFQTPNVMADQSELLETTANCSQYASQKTPMSCQRPCDETVSTSISMQYSFRQTIATTATPVSGQSTVHGRKLILDSMYASPTPARMPSSSENPLSPSANRTHVILSPAHHIQLSVINEEESTRGELSETYVKIDSDHQRTYSVVDGNPATTPADLTRDVKLVGTPLHKKYQSMRELGNENNMSLEQQMLKSNQGSMPNLHKLETVKSIENNRYFCQSIDKDLQAETDTSVDAAAVVAVTVDNDYDDGNDVSIGARDMMDNEHENFGDTSICSIRSTMSTHSVAFKENEILAQSSQFNLNELDKSTKWQAGRFKPAYFCIDKPSSGTARVTSKVSSTPIGQFSVSSPSLNRIGSSHKSLAQSTRDIRASNASISSRPSVISYARAGTSNSNSTTPGKKRVRDENVDLSKKSFSKQSPPKRVRASIDRSQSETELTKGQAFRTKTWGGVLPKKFRVPSVPMQKLTLKRQPEERVILFDPDLHMRGVINPDPFAATTTFDPFLAATMYLDDQAVDKHEIQFKKWLNALVTIPEDIAESSQTIDLGKLFNEVRNKDITLAPTKETVSANYLTKCRMNGLRTAAINLFTSNEMRESLEKLLVHIEKKAIHIRQDRNLHLDVVLQRQILELLLNINPLWLRIGLEVTFGEMIAMANNQDVVSLSAFILNRLFRDRYLEAKHPKVYAHGEAYAEHIKKFTLKKFLCLIYFLDVAKNRKIIKHNPCLFLKTSEFKETKDIMLRFSSSLLGNIGDVLRDLRRIGIVLTHKQTYIDEFDYAFRNLAIDLRDGVRLTRVMEIILLRDDLTCQLRVPAISRTQRIHNVGVALKALEQAEFNLTGKISAADIADGHREKTLSLLWQIIYRFRAPKFNAAAIVIQTWWRKNWLRVCLRRRIRAKVEAERNNAARIIQTAYRGYRARQFVREYAKQRTVAAIVIQSFVRRFLAIRAFNWRLSCIVFIQRWYRNQKIAQFERRKFLFVQQKCVTIQRWYRRHLLAKKMLELVPIIQRIQYESLSTYRSAAVIQTRFRGYLLMRQTRREYLHQRQMIIKIQQHWKATILMREQRVTYQRLRTSVVHVQRVFRAQLAMRVDRTAFVRQRNATIRIQQWFRANQLSKQQRNAYISLQKAAMIIQRRLRAQNAMKMERTRYQQFRDAVVRMQQRFRANKAMQHQREQFEMQRMAAIKIQRKYRACVAMKIERQAYLSLKNATITVQHRYRAKKMATKHRGQFEVLRKAVVCVQQRFRAQFSMKRHRREYAQLRNAATVLQTRFRARVAMKFERNRYLAIRQATIIFQSHYRAQRSMQMQRESYLRMKHAVIFVQRRFRANRQMVEQRNAYFRLQMASVIIQQHYRALIAMRMDRSDYVALREHTVNIQRRFRANCLAKETRSNYLMCLQAVLTIQRKYRANCLMRELRQKYAATRRAVTVIQMRFRAHLLRQKQQQQYQQLQAATIVLQRRFRAQRAMKQQNQDFVQLKQSTVCLQRRFRAITAMRQQRKIFTGLRTATICIQQHLRATLLMRQQRHIYQQQRTSAIYIQHRFRALIEMRHERVRYLIVRRAIITIQRFVRGHQTMKRERLRFLAVRSATITIQRRFVAQQLMLQQRQTYQSIQTATITIQRQFRALQLMKRKRLQYLIVRYSAITIQQHYRATRDMQTVRSAYIQLRQSVICIQRRFRANLLAKTISNQYKLVRCLAICIQQKFRARRLMRKQREEFQRLKAAACTIQRHYRARCAARDHKKLIRSVVALQSRIRGVLTRKRLQQLMTPELIERRRQIQAAKKIQAFWRGYRIRKTRTPLLRQICEKALHLQKNVNQQNIVRNRIQGIIRFLRKRFNVNEALSILKELESISRTVPHTLIGDSAFIAHFCYGIMSQAIRSEADKQVISLCCRILLNLARYRPTQMNVFQIHNFETVAQILSRWCDKDCDIFNVLCTVLWVFIQNPSMNQAIRDFMVTREAIFLLRETKKLVARKERMRTNTPLSWMPVLTPKEKRTMPLLETNYGVNTATKNYIFNSSAFAFDTILSKLKINL